MEENLDYRDSRRLRVLMVPDVCQWATGTEAIQIAKYNPWIEPTIVSGGVLRTLLEEFGRFPGEVDLVHLMTEGVANDFGPVFRSELPVVHSIHHVEDWEFVRPLADCDAIHMVAEQWRQYILQRGVPSDRIVLLPNGVDSGVFQPASPRRRSAVRRRLGIRPESVAVGMCAKRSSNSAARKAPEVYVAAVKELRQHLPQVTAVIVGPGWSDMIEELRSHGIDTVWIPFVENHGDVGAVYQALDLYWVTSRMEGGPMPLLEAMACGVCCVTTPVGVAEEVIKDGKNGFVVSVDDVHAFVHRSRQVVNDAHLCQGMGKAAGETITSRWQWKHTTRSANDLYRRALQRFAERTRRSVPTDAIPEHGIQGAEAGQRSENRCLKALPRKLRSQVRGAEDRLWTSLLVEMGEGALARRRAIRRLLRTPSDLLQWRCVLKLYGMNRTHYVLRILKRAARPLVEERG